MACEAPLLIGVDGGATEVKAHAVAQVGGDHSEARSYELRSESAARCYTRVDGFEPLPIDEQLAQRDAGRIALGEAERAQGDLWVVAAAEAIAEVARLAGADSLLVGVGMPGLKTEDGRGIAAINNGPRIPDYLDELTVALHELGVKLAAPLPALQSDADCCGIGEEHAADGLFRGVPHAYYVGCGTGIADALKLRSALVPFDRARSWLLKAWQFDSALGPTFEQLVATRALNEVATRLSGNDAFPEVAAAAGDPVATAWLDTAALVLAELICERLTTIKSGRAALPHRGAAYAELDSQHAYLGTILERVVVGQRVGQIYADARYHAFFAANVNRYLAAMINATGDAVLCGACLANDGGALRPDLLVASKLRAAPALGAAIVAARAAASA